MRRVLFEWGGHAVYSYPAFLYIGLVAGITVGNLAAHAYGLDPVRTFLATLVLVPPGIVGARVLYVASNWKHYRRNPARIWNRNEGGMAMYGGLPLMLVLSVPLLVSLNLPLGTFWDVGALTILVGMFFTRIGCFLNGCCAGRPSRGPLALYLPDHRGVWESRIPIQCLEAIWALILLAVAVGVRGLLPFPGALFLVVSTGYGIGRLFLEPLRAEAREKGKITVCFWISLAIIFTSIAALAAQWPR